MAIVTKKTFELPSEGLHLAQITRVDDVGQVETSFGVKEKIRIIFTMLDEKSKDGTPLDAMISANKVLGEKSTLGKLLAELKIAAGDTFDTDELIGVKTQVIISHNQAPTTGKIIPPMITSQSWSISLSIGFMSGSPHLNGDTHSYVA